MEVFNTGEGIATSYDYTPFGEISTQGAFEQPIQWSSEVYDEELALTYYNYRHYNPMDGRWINRDPIAERGGANLYGFVGNAPVRQVDGLGLLEWVEKQPEGPVDNYVPPQILHTSLLLLAFMRTQNTYIITQCLQELDPYLYVFLAHFFTGRGQTMFVDPDVEFNDKSGDSDAKNFLRIVMSSVRKYAEKNNSYDKNLYLSKWENLTSSRKTILGDYAVMIKASVDCKTKDVHYTIMIEDIFDFDIHDDWSGVDKKIRNTVSMPFHCSELLGLGIPFPVKGSKSGIDKKSES